jgi:hypothetical protein
MLIMFFTFSPNDAYSPMAFLWRWGNLDSRREQREIKEGLARVLVFMAGNCNRQQIHGD